jgi:deoxyribodipyrimidine photo-lyase
MVRTIKGLFIFHRDLRIIDNIALNRAGELCDELYTCFIFTPEQVTSQNKYKSNNSVQFMIESLSELQSDIKNKKGELMCFYGNQNTVLEYLVDIIKPTTIFFNRDYTPYAIKRGDDTNKLCDKHNIFCQTYSDYYLYEPGSILVDSTRSAYKKYTPFYNAVIDKPVNKPVKKRIFPFSILDKELNYKITLNDAMKRFVTMNSDILVHGGSKQAKLRLTIALRDQEKYDVNRDFFKYKTTHLSAYIKFGCISIRDVYYAVKNMFGLKHGIIRELIWREFFAHVLYAYPEVVGQSYQMKYRSLKWNNSETHIEKWKNGLTGFPIVDACMREMNTTGYMHNRGRMTTASFLIKTLLIDWRIGEQYFAQKLTDYDIASNNGNWQGISGTGVDMKPYFRDMNPWIQSHKFDINAEYIKKWVPELKYVDVYDIHNWHEKHDDTKYINIKYPKPIVDYFKQKERMLDMYQKAN